MLHRSQPEAMNGDGSMEVRAKRSASRFQTSISRASRPSTTIESFQRHLSIPTLPHTHTLSSSQGTEIVIRAATGSLAQMRHVFGQFPLVRKSFFLAVVVDAGRRRLPLLDLHRCHLFDLVARTRGVRALSLVRSLPSEPLGGSESKSQRRYQ